MTGLTAKRNGGSWPVLNRANLNIITTGAFLLFTGLFGFYVVRLLTTTKPVKVAEPVAIAPALIIKHHKHKHHGQLPEVASAKRVMIKKDSIVGAAVKPLHVAAVAPPAVTPPLIIAKASPVAIADSSYSTNLKANLAGLVYLHQTDDYMSPVVSVLPHRSKIKVLEKGSNFYKIVFNEQIGYIPKWTIAKQ